MFHCIEAIIQQLKLSLKWKLLTVCCCQNLMLVISEKPVTQMDLELNVGVSKVLTYGVAGK